MIHVDMEEKLYISLLLNISTMLLIVDTVMIMIILHDDDYDGFSDGGNVSQGDGATQGQGYLREMSCAPLGMT